MAEVLVTAGRMARKDDVHAKGWELCKLGGTPIWLDDNRPSQATCKCGSPGFLMLQLYAPLDGSSHHRVLSIFLCSRLECVASISSGWSNSGLWCIRSLRYEAPELPAAAVETPKSDTMTFETADDWGSFGDDGWGATDTPAEAALDTSLEDLFAQRDQEPVAVEMALAVEEGRFNTLVDESHKGFLPLYVSIFAEPSERIDTSHDKHVAELLAKYQADGGTIGQVSAEADGMASSGLKSVVQEDYEETQVLHGDVAFHKFQQRLGLYPLQFGHFAQHPVSPLQVTSSQSLPETGDVCPHCQEPRQCQVQVWPQVIGELQPAEGKAWDSSCLDFLAFGCYVCTNPACEDTQSQQAGDVAINCSEQLFIVQDSLALAETASATASSATEPQRLQVGGALLGSEQGVTVDDDDED
eukprot:m.219816 g.219816  ORF g.219816 m.219816 type:complete len:413 (+) comp17236_c0_seq4:2675-3913(+)